MRKELVLVELYELGDRVCTPCGNATVMQNEITPTNKYELESREVRVRLDEPTSRWPTGVADLEAWHFTLLGE